MLFEDVTEDVTFNLTPTGVFIFSNSFHMQIGFHASHEQFPPSQLLDLISEAEQNGFGAVLSSDHFHPWSDQQGESGFAWTWLGAAMQKTSLEFGIVNSPIQRYHPAIIAQAAATLDEMFPARFFLALGSGQALNEKITGANWPEKDIRNKRLKESVEIIRELWKGDYVTHHGEMIVENAKLFTTPKTSIPLLGAAISTKTANLISPWTDGMITISKPVDQLKENHENIKLVLSVDRLDYTKGMANRIRAFENFLDNYPQYRKKVSLLMLAVPSRTKVPQYKSLKKEIDQLVGHVNGKFGVINWTPIWYFYRSMPFNNLIDLYTNCDIALITPLRDGMNLVAKEYIATRIDQKGVLILSEMAGAAEEMPTALLINPNNFDEIAFALSVAVEMEEEEQIKRNKILQRRLREFTVNKWSDDFMKKLMSIEKSKNSNSPKEIDSNIFNAILQKYQKSKKRIFFLDYDGTLVGFKNDPQQVVPDSQLKEIIHNLLKDKLNEIVIVSGRDKNTLENWWGDTPVSIIAEHGLYVKKSNSDWISNYKFNSEWINHLISILEIFTEKIPLSFIEKKDNSIVWHYRASEPESAKQAAVELKSLLLQFVPKYDLSILEGNKNIEILSQQVDKGTAVKNYLSNNDNDFVLAFGDDKTDEFMFEKLPLSGISIKVGSEETKAKYRVENFLEVRSFLIQLYNKHFMMQSPSLNGDH